jgi:hypothetical protein
MVAPRAIDGAPQGVAGDIQFAAAVVAEVLVGQDRRLVWLANLGLCRLVEREEGDLLAVVTLELAIRSSRFQPPLRAAVHAVDEHGE